MTTQATEMKRDRPLRITFDVSPKALGPDLLNTLSRHHCQIVRYDRNGPAGTPVIVAEFVGSPDARRDAIEVLQEVIGYDKPDLADYTW